ncbi:MAG: sigma-70 family RNA polymerase sigma factor [Clostridiales bacterium]|jgi:RNA polymerase sigma-B factor|nr:sigma-70 family RNA polymerase sigma factor [Clostridiales bacterium]
MNADDIHNAAMRYALEQTKEAMDDAVAVALPLCNAIAARFTGRGIELEDLRQVAAMALVNALKGFDPGRGLRFTTYVTPTITGTVRNYIRDRAQLVRTPRGLREQGMQMDRVVEQITQKIHREPTIPELAEHLGWTVEQVISVHASREKSQVSSLDAQDENGMMVFDHLGISEKGFEDFEMREDLRKALMTLTSEERTLIKLRFQEQLSQQASAKRMNLTQMQVSRMERRVLRLLKGVMQTT